MLEEVRKLMKKYDMDYMLFKDSDPHMSEYTNDYYKQRTIISKFTGSNGTLIVGNEDAYLFTDGRYFIQAEKELRGSGIKLMKMGEKDCPSILSFLNNLISQGKKVFTSDKLTAYKDFLTYNFSLNDYSDDLFYEAYKNKNGTPYPIMNVDSDVEILDISLTGESTASKLERIRSKMSSISSEVFISADLASNMWIYNIRGNAVPHNPVAFSYSVITKDKAYLFLMNSEKITDFIDEVSIEEYDGFEKFLKENICDKTAVSFSFSKTPAFVGHLLKDKNCRLIDNDCDVCLFKAIKNDTEIENMRIYYKKDNAILKEFLKFVKNSDLSSLNEFDLAEKLDNMRLSDKDCSDLSFDTISAFGPNGAMMHYEATKESNSFIGKDNLYLVDSGGQWSGATTDVTRTVSIGTPSYKMKHDYTRVLRGLLHLQNAVFMEGVTGVNLDILARLPMWEEGDDYKCGTGHGIGYRLCVHEGPNSIRWRHTKDDAVLKPGMIMSDEPGIYRENEYGIRLENVILVKEKCETSDGRFLCFECLTYVPFDEDLILREEMSEKELLWLDEYMMKC